MSLHYVPLISYIFFLLPLLFFTFTLFIVIPCFVSLLLSTMETGAISQCPPYPTPLCCLAFCFYSTSFSSFFSTCSSACFSFYSFPPPRHPISQSCPFENLTISFHPSDRFPPIFLNVPFIILESHLALHIFLDVPFIILMSHLALRIILLISKHTSSLHLPPLRPSSFFSIIYLSL